MDRFLDQFERHKYGIVGTMVLHTLVVFALAMSHLPEEPREDQISDLRLEMAPPITEEEFKAIEQALAEDRPLPTEPVQNVTSNITAERTSQAMDARSMARLDARVEEELRAFEQAEFDRLEEERKARGEEIEMPELDPSKWDKELYMDKAAEPVKVEGPTTVWHDLKDRTRSNDVPGYLCRHEGRVAVRVSVDRTGQVIKAELDAARSANADDCMIEHALGSSRRARFSPAPSAPDPQKGTVFFLFLRQ